MTVTKSPACDAGRFLVGVGLDFPTAVMRENTENSNFLIGSLQNVS